MTKPFSTKARRRSRILAVASIAVWSTTLLIFGGYVVVANDLATKGIERGSIQQELHAAERQKQELLLRSAKTQSLDDLSADPALADMVEIGSDIRYVSPAGASVALR